MNMTQPTPQRISNLRRLIALEVARIVDDLETRERFLVHIWSKHRDRRPFLDTLFNRWRTIDMALLSHLELDEVYPVESFFRELDDFRMYISYTEDMPTTLTDRYSVALEVLREFAEEALDALGGAPVRVDVVEADQGETHPLLAFALDDAIESENASAGEE